jgi:hypothetical protein
MWSQLDQATGSYRLVKSVDGGAPAPVAVPERAGGPFDIDLGTNRSGSTYAVYTRDGDTYHLGVVTGVETKITKLSSPTLAERDPTIQRGQIAFIRRDGGYDQLRVGDTTSASKGSRFLVKKRSIGGAELAIKQVAYVEQSGGSEVVHVRNVSAGHDQAVYRATSGGANFAASRGRPTTRTPTPSCGRARTSARAPATASCATRCPARSSATRRARRATTRRRGPPRSSAPPPRRRWTAATASTRATTPARTTAT